MEGKKDVFIEITNHDIYEEIQKIKKLLLGNGKLGLVGKISNIQTKIKIQWALFFVIMGALVKVAFL